MNNLLKLISTIKEPSPALISALQKNIVYGAVQKKQLLLKAGQICHTSLSLLLHVILSLHHNYPVLCRFRRK